MSVRSRSSTGASLEIRLEEGMTKFSAHSREDIYWSHEERIPENGLSSHSCSSLSVLVSKMLLS
jgi:hypothetical protein